LDTHRRTTKKRSSSWDHQQVHYRQTTNGIHRQFEDSPDIR
jgi:hypothetical protein